MAITLESIEKKLGFDPLNPPTIDESEPLAVDDNTPSIWEPLTEAELDFLIKLDYERRFSQ